MLSCGIKSPQDNRLLPGGMGARMFYQHCREGGLNITREETDFMRDAWIQTFSEMQRHMQPKPIPPSDKIRRKYGFVPDDDDEFEDPDQGRQLFIAHCIDGFTRNRALVQTNKWFAC